MVHTYHPSMGEGHKPEDQEFEARLCHIVIRGSLGYMRPSLKKKKSQNKTKSQHNSMLCHTGHRELSLRTAKDFSNTEEILQDTRFI